MNEMESLPTLETVLRAADRIAPHAHRTPIMHSRSLDDLTGASVLFKCENLQRAGAFKFRGACNAVWSLPAADAARGVATHSSGNHGAALALAASTRGIPAHVVVPHSAVAVKVAAIRTYGATVHSCDSTLAARDAMTARVCAETGAVMIHPYTDCAVIAGQGTAALELLRDCGKLDAIITPVGGGGLIGGTGIVAKVLYPKIKIFAAEPEGAQDAWQSMQRGERVAEVAPDTICDGLRALIGPINFALLQKNDVTVLRVSDAETVAAMRVLWERLKLVVEPSSATAFAAITRYRDCFAGRRIGVILSGGNVDLEELPW